MIPFFFKIMVFKMKSVVNEAKKVINNYDMEKVKSYISPNRFNIYINQPRGYTLKTVEKTNYSKRAIKES